MRKVKKKIINQELMKTIRILRAASKKSGKALWSALADDLDRAKRKRFTVNLSKINRHTDANDVVAVPGKVLASGSLDHSVTVAAISFSEIAAKKIELVEGRAVSFETLLEEGVEPSKITILK